MPINWKQELAVAVIVKNDVQAADTTGLWQHHLPDVAATEDQITMTERALGFSIDAKYREFLRHANGWKKFLQNIDIHGTHELTSEAERQSYAGLIGVIEGEVFTQLGILRSEVYVVAGSAIEGDMFCMTRNVQSTAGQVFWIAGTLVDRFPSFDEFFLALVDYNRRELQRLQGKL